MAGEAVRATAVGLASLAIEVGVGVWLLLLCALAMVWDPFDRRLGFHDRRHGVQPSGARPAISGAYGLGGPVADREWDGEDDRDQSPLR